MIRYGVVLLLLVPALVAGCKTSTSGKEYMGTRSHTKSGLTCQRWDSQSPHKHSNNEYDQFPDVSVDAAANYCRSPDGDPKGPWCYTNNAAKRWEYCDIKLCTGCKTSTLGKEYMGTRSYTKSGLTCQRWDSQSPHKHFNNKDAKFPDGSVVAAVNYCRNPDDEPKGPWCYTNNAAKRWEYCDVKLCTVVDCTTTVENEFEGMTGIVHFVCPIGNTCLEGGEIWGGPERYTDDSALCRSAIQMYGSSALKEHTTLSIEILGTFTNYIGTNKNEVDSLNYSSSSKAYRFVGMAP